VGSESDESEDDIMQELYTDGHRDCASYTKNIDKLPKRQPETADSGILTTYKKE